MRYNHLTLATTQLHTYNRNLFLASNPDKEDCFFFCVKVAKGNYRKLARIYRLRNDWYIWYENGNYRQRINSTKPLTAAIKILEKEFQNCVA